MLRAYVAGAPQVQCSGRLLTMEIRAPRRTFGNQQYHTSSMCSRNFKWRCRLLILKLTNCVQVLCKYRMKYKHNPVNFVQATSISAAACLPGMSIYRSLATNINRRSRTRSLLLIDGSCGPRRKNQQQRYQ